MFGSKNSSTIAAESRRLADFELAWSNKLVGKRGEIRDVEASLGDACNQPVEQSEAAVTKASERLAALHADIATIHRTIEAARQKRRTVLQELQVTRARELRRDAQETRRAADELMARGDKALAAFAEIEEVPLEKVVNVCRGYLTLRTDALRARASESEGRAQDLDRAGVPDAGIIDVDDVTGNDQVVDAALGQDVIAPAVDDIRAWLAAVEKASKKDFGDRPRRVRMLWRGGKINHEDSFVFVKSLAPVITLGGAGLMETQRYDVEAATFRAAAAA